MTQSSPGDLTRARSSFIQFSIIKNIHYTGSLGGQGFERDKSFQAAHGRNFKETFKCTRDLPSFPLGYLRGCVIGLAWAVDSSESGKVDILGVCSWCTTAAELLSKKNSLWSMLCSPHTNLLPVSLPERHSFFKCLQGGGCGMLFFLPQEISNPFRALNWYVAPMFLAEYKELFLGFQIWLPVHAGK